MDSEDLKLRTRKFAVRVIKMTDTCQVTVPQM